MLYLDPLVNNQDVKHLRGHLEEEYLQMAPSSRRIGYITKHLGYQNMPSNNYWYLGEEVILFKFLLEILAS
jgi:hypothetical protein